MSPSDNIPVPADRTGHVFGPVSSRRLGASLGVNVIPLKVCSLDCIYCEAGRTNMLTLERREYVSRDVIIEELKTALPSAGHIDHITLSATGEPTLHSRLGEIIRRIKRITSLPVAVLTNGTLLTEKDVREDLLDADVVLPSLDAASPETFRRLNRPHGRIDLMSVIGGLAQFRREYKGPIWLEVLFVKGINDSGLDVRRTREAIERIRPDKVHLNTVVRPPSELCAHPLSRTELEEIARVLDMNCEVIC